MVDLDCEYLKEDGVFCVYWKPCGTEDRNNCDTYHAAEEDRKGQDRGSLDG
jgi:hypothetical protein